MVQWIILTVGNSILSVHYQIVSIFFAETCINFLCKLNIFMSANVSIKEFAEEINDAINKLILSFP